MYSDLTGELAKAQCFMAVLDGGVASLHLDPRRPGVQVPARYRDQDWLVLNYSHAYRIKDFAIDDGGVTATLSFGGSPYTCRVPWAAVFGVTDEQRTRGLVWEEDMPASVRQRGEALADTQARPKLAAVTGGRQGPPTPRAGGHLRRIK